MRQGETCQCKWPDIQKDTNWQGAQGYISIASESAEQCALSCCYRSPKLDGCKAWGFHHAAGPQKPGDEGNCFIWMFMEGVTTVAAPGYSISRNGPPAKHCKVPEGQNWQAPVIPKSAAWNTIGVFALVIVVYAGGGMSLLVRRS